MGNAQAKAQVESIMESMQANITNVIMKYSTSINNGNSNTQFFKFVIGPQAVINYCNIEASNNTVSEIKTLSNISSENAVQLSTALKSTIQSTINQNAQAISQILGGNADAQTITTIKQRVEQIINNQISSSNVVGIANSIINNQGLDVVLNGVVNCDKDANPKQTLTFSNNIQAKLTSDTIVKNVTKAIVNDSILNSISQSITQKATAKNQGLIDLIIAIAILGLVYLMISSKSNPTLKTIMLILMLGLIGYLAYSYVKKTGVFKKQYWGCNIVNGMNAGCKQYDNEKDGPYQTKEDCEAKSLDGKVYLHCPQYWGCNKDDKGNNVMNANPICKQLVNVPADGSMFFGTQDECVIAGAGDSGVCGVSYGCKIDALGYVDPNATECQQYNNDMVNLPSNLAVNKNQCDVKSCKGYYMCKLDSSDTSKKSCSSIPQKVYDDIQCCFDGGCGINKTECSPAIIQAYQNKLFTSKSDCDDKCK